jgi:hypothetical protein
MAGVIGIGRVALDLLRKKMKDNRDDLVGYWQSTFNRQEHYPHGVRDKEDAPDMTGNLRVDYTLFGYEQSLINV